MVTKARLYIGASFLFHAASPLIAQELPAARTAAEIQDETEADVGTIVVTGSRLPSTFTAPTPVTVVSADQLRTSSPASVGEALAQLPAFAGSQLTSNLGRATSVVGAAQALLNLRGLGSNRTLVLLDGERLPASNLTGSVDINIIPQVLLSRVDVVTGGASSSYGSDAVAGVVNFIIDTKFQGLKLDASLGQTVYNDNGNHRIQAAFGTSFAGGRGRLVASADYFRLSGINLGPTGRKWYDAGAGFSTLPAGSPTVFGLIPDPRVSTMAFGGLVDQVTSNSGAAINVAGLSNAYFGPGAVLQPFDFGTNRGPSFQSGGSGPRAEQGISPSQRRIGGFAHAEYDLADNLTVFAGALYSNSRNDSENFYAFQQGPRGFRVYADNAYLPTAVRNLMTANNVASFRIGRLSREIPWLNRSETELLRFNAGVRGEIASGWDFDANMTYGRSKQDFGQQQSIVRNLYAAADAVLDPAGKIVCRSTLSGFDPGCVPINVLGPDSIDAAALPYVAGFVYGYTRVQQLAGGANIRGDLGEDLQLGAGPITVAAGAAYRSERTARTVSPLSNTFVNCTGLRAGGCAAFSGQYGGYAAYNPAPLNGTINVAEAYGELGVPLLKDISLIQSLDLNAAVRVTNYNVSGTVATWKVGSSWQVNDDLRLRITRSRDIRAPSPEELFATVSRTGSVTSVLYPNSTAPGPLQTITIAVTTGNPNLKPEIASTLTAGGVYTPSWLPGLQLSVDYYSIDLRGAIAGVATQVIVDSCARGDQAFCSLITVGGNPVTGTAQLNGAGGISVRAAPVNIAQVKVSGLDAELSYLTDLAGGKLNLRALGSYALTNSNSADAAPNGPIRIGAYGVGGGVPRWTLNLRQGYEKGGDGANGFGFNLEERIIAPGTINPNYTPAQFPLAANRVRTIMTVNAGAHYDFNIASARTQIYLTVQNLLNRAPPSVPTATSVQLPTNFDIYDVLGQRFTLGVRVRL